MTKILSIGGPHKVATTMAEAHDYVLDYFRASCAASKFAAAYRVVADDDGVVSVVSTSRDADWYLFRLYAQLAASLKRRHGVLLAGYPCPTTNFDGNIVVGINWQTN